MIAISLPMAPVLFGAIYWPVTLAIGLIFVALGACFRGLFRLVCTTRGMARRASRACPRFSPV